MKSAATEGALRATQGSRETLLLVEDDAALIEIMQDALVDSGYQVLAATDGHQALELCRRHAGPIDLVVTDIVMPRMSGCEMARRLADERPGLRVLFVSGYTVEFITHKGDSFDDIELLPKPFGEEVLLARVRELLDRPSQ